MHFEHKKALFGRTLFEPLEERMLLSGGWDVVLIDSQLADHDLLVRSAAQAEQIVIYDSQKESSLDVLSRMEVLAQSSEEPIQSLSILSHGAPGGFALGSDWISNQYLQQTNQTWSEVGALLSDDATIYIYGCNVAADVVQGQKLINTLADLTGADVAASVNDTGHALLGGDWQLEYTAGAVETSVLFSEDMQQDWLHLMSLETYYLDGVGDGSDVPTAILKPAAPTDPTLDNFDPGRDAFGGLLISKGGADVNESDPTKQQAWIVASGGTVLDGSVSLTLWSAIKDFTTDKSGSVTAYLVDSNSSGGDLTQIASTTITRADWDTADSGTWIEDSFDFGSVSYTIGAGRYLGVKIIVADSSGDDMWFAYDATSYQSRLEFTTTANTPPVINDQSLPNLDENSANGTVVGTVLAGDPDAGDSLSYSITAGNGAGVFAINPSTGQITVADNTNLNYEATSSYGLTVQVEDSGTLTDTATITVNVTDVNEAPSASDDTFSLAEDAANGTVVGTVSASDPDAGDSLTYSITAGNTGGAFAIDSNTGQISVANTAALDYETNPSFNLTVQVSDSGTPGLTDTATITISLNDLNEGPTVNNQGFSLDENSANGTVAVSDQGFSLDENSANGTVVGAVEASEPLRPDYSDIQYLLSEQDSSLTADYADTRYSLGEIVLPEISLPEMTSHRHVTWSVGDTYIIGVYLTEVYLPAMAMQEEITPEITDNRSSQGLASSEEPADSRRGTETDAPSGRIDIVEREAGQPSELANSPGGATEAAAAPSNKAKPDPSPAIQEPSATLQWSEPEYYDLLARIQTPKPPVDKEVGLEREIEISTGEVTAGFSPVCSAGSLSKLMRDYVLPVGLLATMATRKRTDSLADPGLSGGGRRRER